MREGHNRRVIVKNNLLLTFGIIVVFKDLFEAFSSVLQQAS
jgi:hypothetical protein